MTRELDLLTEFARVRICVADQLWQSRIFYFHYIRLRELAGPCGDIGGFTRLLTQPASAKPDALMAVMRTVVVAELTSSETMGFVVLNRPHSVCRWCHACTHQTGAGRALQQLCSPFAHRC